MEFCEANQEWQSIPAWTDFLIRVGQGWLSEGSRRIALISMPCDSAGAGLIALGVLIRDLANPLANDTDGHYDRLLNYARQHLKDCLHCDLKICAPEEKRCGYVTKATGKVRAVLQARGTYQISERTSFPERKLAWQHRNGVIEWPNPQYATEWYIDGEPPPEWIHPQGVLPESPYRKLVQGTALYSGNLKKSYSGTCLAGRASGETASREACGSIRFRDGTTEYGLEELLTVHGWSTCNVSRVSFFNSRLGKLDRNGMSPSLVVADGDASFLDILGKREFQNSDIIGVIHRAIERDRLEAVGAKMLELTQWYKPDEDMLCGLPSLPRGISVSILRRPA